MQTKHQEGQKTKSTYFRSKSYDIHYCSFQQSERNSGILSTNNIFNCIIKLKEHLLLLVVWRINFSLDFIQHWGNFYVHSLKSPVDLMTDKYGECAEQ